MLEVVLSWVGFRPDGCVQHPAVFPSDGRCKARDNCCSTATATNTKAASSVWLQENDCSCDKLLQIFKSSWYRLAQAWRVLAAESGWRHEGGTSRIPLDI